MIKKLSKARKRLMSYNKRNICFLLLVFRVIFVSILAVKFLKHDVLLLFRVNFNDEERDSY